ncbi:MAG: hypothetical protein JSS61_03830 [Verrucomicrobia bacterium]|nr:hypothetical protein [Verrucomicrobiota bacterium]
MRFLFLLFVLSSFCDPELETVWSSLSDITNPTREDYQKLDTYLLHARRSYLDPLRISVAAQIEMRAPYESRLNRILQFRLLGPNGEMPEMEILSFSGGSKDRCILLYATHNGIYQSKMEKLLEEIRQSGFQGDVIVRRGGFPNTAHGGLKLCHIPYAFKAAYLCEAKALGYKNALWVDLAMHPLVGFESIFREIEESGYFFTNVGTLEDNRPRHLLSAAKSLGITHADYPLIPHLSSALLGLNFENERALALLDTWICALETVKPAISWFPEELSLSVIAWRLGCVPYCYFWDFTCAEVHLGINGTGRPFAPFWLDTAR